MTINKRVVSNLRKLRADGLTLREISSRTGVAFATVHRHVRDVAMEGHHPREPFKVESKTDHGFPKVLGRYIGMERQGRRYQGLLVHLPDQVVCPVCKEETNDVVFCLDCGKCWIADCGHGSELSEESHEGINLGELRRKKGDGELHVFPMVFRRRD